MNPSHGGKRQLSWPIQSWPTTEHLDKLKKSFLSHPTSGYSLGIEAHQTWSSFLGSTGGPGQTLGFTSRCFNVKVGGVSRRFSVATDQDIQSMCSIDPFCLVVKNTLPIPILLLSCPNGRYHGCLYLFGPKRMDDLPIGVMYKARYMGVPEC